MKSWLRCYLLEFSKNIRRKLPTALSEKTQYYINVVRCLLSYATFAIPPLNTKSVIKRKSLVETFASANNYHDKNVASHTPTLYSLIPCVLCKKKYCHPHCVRSHREVAILPDIARHQNLYVHLNSRHT